MRPRYVSHVHKVTYKWTIALNFSLYHISNALIVYFIRGLTHYRMISYTWSDPVTHAYLLYSMYAFAHTLRSLHSIFSV